MPHLRFSYGKASAILEELEPGKLYSLRNMFSRTRGQGHANGVMDRIVEYADKNNSTIILVIQRYGYNDHKALNNKQLEEFYRKFGFVKDTEKDETFLTHMTRYPIA